MAGEPLAPGEIHDANGPMLRAALEPTGALTTLIGTAATHVTPMSRHCDGPWSTTW